ncbi:electron transfer flavoprotein subunit alpha [candidate division KSB1 bacterium]|nr:electron transfer flavoprotein subunit alpha [candidate division KSB1 bacterium]RQW01464.1 MAG: electron transfer flavoprotein subunit alpha [candidate division KSB1 bacterium]
MEKILFLSHTEENGHLSPHALETLTAASRIAAGLGGELLVGLYGGSTGDAVQQVSGKTYTIEEKIFAVSRYATDAAAAEAICRAAGATIVVAPGTSRTMRYLSGVAARLDGKVDTHITGLSTEGGLMLHRWYYRQRMRAEIRRSDRPWFIAVESGIFEKFVGTGGTVESVSVVIDDKLLRTSVQGFKSPVTGEQTIRPDADTLFVAGAGWTKKQADGQTHTDNAADLILDFLKKSGASLGSSKSLVDLKGEGQSVLPFMTHLNQVGQTGSTPRHPKGLATCCHGEEPHVVGWRFITERRAINLDPNCGWAQGKADVLYVADAFAVIEEINKLLG